MDTRFLKACIFDFDGVIVNSEEIQARAKEATLNHFKISYPEKVFERFKGRADPGFFAYVSEDLTKGQISSEMLLEHKKSIYSSLFEEVRLIQGVQEFILFARSRFEQIGITTSTSLHDFSLANKRFQIEKHFDFIITGEDTQNHKPDPEPYLMAIKELDFDLDQVMVIEDSPNGIRSAKTAGLSVFGITTSFPAEELLKSGANYVVHSFKEIKEFLEP